MNNEFKSEALRLANECDECDECDEGMVDFAAVAEELRRLQAENEALREANEAFAARQDWWNDRMFELETQRDQLLEALKLARLMLIAHGETHAKIDKAIARAEGKQ